LLIDPQEITFAEMRAAGVRGLLVCCSDYHCSHWIARSAAINGPMMPAYLIWSPDLNAGLAAGAVLM
jgi:hypothetical protein